MRKEHIVETKEEQDKNESPKFENKLPHQESIEAAPEHDPVVKLQEELTEQKNNYLRLYADFENYKKRSIKERMDLFKIAGAEIITNLLPVLDDFERALKATESLEEKHPVREGMVLIYNKLKTLLEQKGLKPMETAGTEFDTDLHDAITSIDAGKQMKGKVVEEVEKGYYLNDKVIRHAKVIVGS